MKSFFKLCLLAGLLLVLFIGISYSDCQGYTGTSPVVSVDNSNDLQVARAGSGQKYKPPAKPAVRPTSGPAGGVTRRVTTTRRYDSGRRGGFFFIPFVGGSGGGGGCGICGCLFTLLIIIIIIIILVKVFGKKGDPNAPPAHYHDDDADYVEEVVEEYYEPAPGVQGPAMPSMFHPEKIEEGKQKIMQTDRNFSERVFIDKAQTTFYLVQKAWNDKKPEKMRDVVSDSVYKRFVMQIDELKKKGQTNVLEDIVIGGAKLVDVKTEGGYDSITVRFNVSMTDFTVDDKTGQVVYGDKNEPIPFTEYWTFTRKTGKTTESEDTIKAKKCPNCGAPLSVTQSGECEYCGVGVMSSSFDWVLDTITQEGED